MTCPSERRVRRYAFDRSAPAVHAGPKDWVRLFLRLMFLLRAVDKVRAGKATLASEVLDFGRPIAQEARQARSQMSPQIP
jgi:hypothetical protein